MPEQRRLLEWAPRLFLVFAIFLQLQTGLATLPSDLIQADPPTHFTTGVMLHDYLRNGHPLHPFPFAECFYVHYPKVAFGHWPPVFYIIEAVWFLIFGTKIVAARWLCACITAACATALYRRCSADWGQWASLTVTALFLALPLIRQQTWLVMSDLLLAGFLFLALCSLADFLHTGSTRDVLWLSLWSSLAILTKGTGWLLLAPIAAAPVLTGRVRLYTSRNYWLGTALTCLISAPFYILMMRLNLAYPVGLEGYLHRLKALLLDPIWLAIGTALLTAGAAVLWRYAPRKPLPPIHTISSVFAIWSLTLASFIVLFPLTPELARYSIAAIPPGAYLLAAGITILNRRLLVSLVSAGVFAICFPLPVNATAAYSQAMGRIPIAPGSIVMVESDSGGEGALIAARLDRDRDRSTYLVRGSKFLEITDWSGVHATPKYTTPEAVRSALESVDPDYVIQDTSAPPSPEAKLLMEVLQGQGSGWKIEARLPVRLSFRSGQLLVFHRQSPSHQAGAPLSVQLAPERGLQSLSCKAWQE